MLVWINSLLLHHAKRNWNNRNNKQSAETFKLIKVDAHAACGYRFGFVLGYFIFYFNPFNLLTMTANKISLKKLSSIMFQVFDKVSLDMGYYQPMFSGLISEMNFRYKIFEELEGAEYYDCLNEFEENVEDLFLDRINRMDMTEEKFYNICSLFIEPIYITKSLTA